MTTAVARTADQESARPLKVLVPLILDELERGRAAGLEHYRRAGEMLLEAKEQIAHGEWGPWLKRNFALSHTTATTYMRLVTIQNKSRISKSATLSEIVHPERPHHQPLWHAPVQQMSNRVDMEALVQDTQSKAEEAQLARVLGLQLIDIGYKVLSTKLHPDKGGSTEAMARLNRVRDLLKHAV
jgi:hypothetical protein